MFLLTGKKKKELTTASPYYGKGTKAYFVDPKAFLWVDMESGDMETQKHEIISLFNTTDINEYLLLVKHCSMYRGYSSGRKHTHKFPNSCNLCSNGWEKNRSNK